MNKIKKNWSETDTIPYNFISFKDEIEYSTKDHIKKAKNKISPINNICEKMGGLEINSNLNIDDEGLVKLTNTYLVKNYFVKNEIDQASMTRTTQVIFELNGLPEDLLITKLKLFYGEKNMHTGKTAYRHRDKK